MPSQSKLYIGTSGFSYPYWKGRFYPAELKQREWLRFYSQQFNALELNYTFYRFPVVKNLEKAAGETPRNFRFSVKVHKIVTHSLRVKNSKSKITEFTDIVTAGLGSKLGCLLFQFPASYTYTDERMNDILENIPNHKTSVIEFRHDSWCTEAVTAQLKKNRISFCNSSFPGLPDTAINTTNLFYKRMHGVPQLFVSSYSKNDIQQLADSIPEKKECYVFFNNTTYEAGYQNAKSLRQMLVAKHMVIN